MPETDAERAAIREQLERILSSPLFKNSKRYPTLLRFVVERSLTGHTEPLKERTLGIEVFGREPDYDTNLDPVVRTTAVEIRKRIAQYYHEPGHEREIRIDFPPGTYLPEFRMPPKPAVTSPPPELPRRPKILIASLITGAVAASAIFLLWPKASPSALDQFWAPVLRSPVPISLYIGGYPTEAVSGPVVTVMDLMRSERVAFADATALAKITSLLVFHKKRYRIRLQTSSQMEDLTDGPAVLIGAFNNSWTLRLTGQLRFSFVNDREHHIEFIRDSRDPGTIKWSDHTLDTPYAALPRDYAIVSRVEDSSTGKIFVTASGLAKFGTEAAGEFLTNPAYMQEISKKAPRGWDHMNMEIVITADVVGRSAGPPHVLATHFW